MEARPNYASFIVVDISVVINNHVEVDAQPGSTTDSGSFAQGFRFGNEGSRNLKSSNASPAFLALQIIMLKSEIRTITDVYRRFYKTWDETAYQSYLARFMLDPKKKIKQLSQGMSIKFALALALSHHAELLILDEPTSGLDPVSRDLNC